MKQMSPRCFMSTLLTISLLVALWGCDEPPPPSPPVVLKGTLSCERVGGDFILDRLELLVEDLDGTDNLLNPYVAISSIPLPLMSEILPAFTPEEAAMNNAGPCSAESCWVRYSWVAGGENEMPIYCGDAGTDLVADVRIFDIDGEKFEGILNSTAAE